MHDSTGGLQLILQDRDIRILIEKRVEEVETEVHHLALLKGKLIHLIRNVSFAFGRTTLSQMS